MKLVGYYYLSYPEDSSSDPTFAVTEMWAEVGLKNDTHRHHQGTYSFWVYTHRYLEEYFIKPGLPLLGRSILIVPTLETAWMDQFLEANIEGLREWGTLI